MDKSEFAHEEHNSATERKIEAGNASLQPVTIEEVKYSMEQLRLQIRKSANYLIKWQIGIGIVLVLCLARGFGWIG